MPKKIQKDNPRKSSVPDEVPGLLIGGGATAFRIVLKYQSSNRKRTWKNKQGRLNKKSSVKCLGDERVVTLANKEEDEVTKMRIDGV